MQVECPRLVHKMAKRKEMTLIGPDKLENYDIAEDPNGSESPSDMIGLSVSNVTANEFFYDEDFAIPFDANLTDGQVAPLDDSLLLYSMTSDGGVSSNQFSGDEATLSPYRTVVELSDSDVDVDQSVMRRVTSSASEGGGSEDYWGTDSRLLRGCGVSVENLDQLGGDVDRSGELELSRSTDSLTQEMDCDGPEVRLTTWAEVGMGSTRSLSRKPEVSDTDEIKTSSGSSEESDQYESSRLVTWARLDKGCSHSSLDDRFERVFESVDSVETGFMQNSGSQLALATGYDASLVANDTNFLNGALAVGMTTWRTLVTSDRHSGSTSSRDDIQSTEEDWSNDGGCLTSPKRAESVSSPSSKDDGYDSVTKDLSMNDDSQSIQDSDESQDDQCDEDQQHLLQGSADGVDSVESTSMYPGVELPEILRQALAESRLCSSISTTGDLQREVPYHLLDSSLVDLQSVEDQQRSVEALNHPAVQGRGVPDEKNTRTNEILDSLNASISSSCQQSAVAPETPFTDTSAASLWSSDADTKLFSLTDERQGQQLQGAHTLPRLSKRLNSWSKVNSEATSSTKSFVFRSLMRPLPDLGFLRKSSTRSDRDNKQNLRICSERKTQSEDTRKEKQPILNSGYLRPHQNAIERDSVESSRRKESLLETVNRGTSSRFCPTLTRTRSRNSDSAFSEHSSTSSGIDPGIVDLDDGYGTWNYRKSALKVQNQFMEPWSSITQEMPHEAKRSCKEFGVDGGESRDVNRKTERLVVKLCNACNIRTVHLEKENQPSQRSLLFSADLNTDNLLTSPPKIIVSSADKTSNKNFAFDMVDLSETSRFVNIALDTGKIGNSNIIKLHSISHKEHTDTMSNAFDTVKSQDSRTLCQRNLEKCLNSEDNIEANFWSKVSGNIRLEALVNHDSKSDAVIDGKEKRQQLLTNCSAIREEVNEQFANTTGPKTVYVEFDREKDISLKRMERQGYKRGKEIQIVPRANKNVSILENGVRFRPGFTPSEAASQCTASNAVGFDSDDRKKLQTDVTAGVFLKSIATNYSDQVARSPIDDQPPIDFLVSPDIDSILEGRPSSMKKTDLLLNVMRSVESLLHHFNRNRDLQVQCGSTQHDRKVGHLVLDQLCPALRAILLDGLKPDVQGLFGTVRNSVRQVIEDSATMGRPPNLVGDLVTSLKRLKFLNTPSLFFNAFVFALLNCKVLDFWLSYIHSQASLLQKHYTPDSFLRLNDSSANRTFQDLVSFLQPLALVPFRLEYNFEVRLLEERLEEGDREMRALEGHPETTDTYRGQHETQEKFPDTRLPVNSRKLEEKRSYLRNAELVLSESLDEAQRNSWLESNDEFELNRQTHCALKSRREDANEVRSSRGHPRSSPDAADARVVPSVDPTRTEPRVIAINHGAKYSPGCRNYPRSAEVMSPLRPDIQIIYNEQEEQVSRRGADSSVVLTQHSNYYSATRNLWSDYKQRIGVVKNRLEKLVFGTS